MKGTTVSEDRAWHESHDNLVTLTAWMADNGHNAAEVAYAVEKPWKFEDLFRQAAADGSGADLPDYEWIQVSSCLETMSTSDGFHWVPAGAHAKGQPYTRHTQCGLVATALLAGTKEQVTCQRCRRGMP
jgi:hypothetical protein